MEIYKELNTSASKEFEKLLNSQLSKIKIEEGKGTKPKSSVVGFESHPIIHNNVV